MEFFTEEGSTRVELFSLEQFIPLGITILCIYLIYRFKNKLINFGHEKTISITMAVIMFMNFVIYYGSKILLGTYSYKTDLPLHFCFVTGFTFMFILITKNKHKLYKIIYFCTFIGPLPAILLPDLNCTFDRYLYWQFIISHHVMIVFSVYALLIFKYEVEKKDIFTTFITAHIFVIIMMIFNSIVGSNYVMLSGLPDQIYEVFPFTKYAPPLVWLELVAVISLFVAYIPAYFVNKEKRLNENKISEIKS